MDRLFLHFNSRVEYYRAVKHFNERSDFFAEDYNDELMQITFEEQNSVDALEEAITDELEDWGFACYWFTSKEDFC